MDAEALRGRRLGTGTLQQVIGTGTMGAVYLAHQWQPPRQVVVKVFLRLASLELPQQREFLAIFRDEMACVFSLEHPNILSVYDYGDLDGLAYIMTPYIDGETLEDVLSREGALPLQTAAHYLHHIAAALDYAHARGVVHRDLKPANILVTPEKRVLVADFHLTSMLIEGKTAQMRLFRPGMLDYMSPELVLSKEVDGRADLYSLGALLYRMVTGTPPFQGQTLMKVATKHLKVTPPSPRAGRPDLPPAAEQVIIKALAKNPAQRFESALDMSLLFQQSINALTAPQGNAPLPSVGTRLIAPATIAPPTIAPANSVPTNGAADPAPADSAPANATSPHVFAPGMLFGPNWRTRSMAAIATGQSESDSSTGALNLQRQDGTSSASLPSVASTDAISALNGQPRLTTSSRELAATQRVVQANPLTPADQTISLPEAAASASKTWALPEIKQDESGTTGAYKLTGPARIVSIPVAGQPGQYITGILPSSLQPVSMPLVGLPASAPAPTTAPAQAPVKHPLLRRWRVPIFVLAALLVVCGSLGFVFIHSALSHHPVGLSTPITGGTPNIAATATAAAKATQDANTIFSDSLSQNIRGWPEASSGAILYQFKDGAYHITNNDPARVATAILPGDNLDLPFVYTLTMDEVRGDDTSVNNEFGMILRFNSQVKNGKPLITFYTFEVVNKKGGQYQFWKYDNSQGGSADPWKQLASHPFGSEFHQGQGVANSNTFKILVSGKSFTLIVNGKQAWSVQDSSLVSGQVGMLVNLKGTEVAFSNLRLTLS